MQKNIYIPDNEKYFRTTNFTLACLLYTKDHELVNADKTNPKKVEFVFIATPETSLIHHNFSFGFNDNEFTNVDIRKYEVAQKALKRILYDNLI